MFDPNHIRLATQDLLLDTRFCQFMLELLTEDLGVLRSPHTGDPHTSSYNAGLQAAGLVILARLEQAHPRALLHLLSHEPGETDA